MEHLKKILANVNKSPVADVDYRKVFQEVLALFHAALVNLTGVRDDEVSILLTDKRENLKFYRPQYLASAGVIPLHYTKAFVVKALQQRIPCYENRFANITHLSLFEEFHKNNPDQRPIQKMMCIPLVTEGGVAFGALEICKKGSTSEEAGPDWSQSELEEVVNAVEPLTEDLHRLCVKAKIL